MQLIDAVPDFTPMLPHVVYQLEVLAVICDENQRWVVVDTDDKFINWANSNKICRPPENVQRCRIFHEHLER